MDKKRVTIGQKTGGKPHRKVRIGKKAPAKKTVIKVKAKPTKGKSTTVKTNIFSKRARDVDVAGGY